jgi:PKD repeat protein
VDVPDAIVGRVVNLIGSFTDPGTQDTHTAQVDWDDGTVDDLGAVAGTISASHIFSAPGQFTVALTVKDDDGGEGSATRQISVREPSSSELIDGILAFFDECVEAGTLEGVGHRSWLAKCRLRFMRIVLNLAKRFIERDRTKAACHMLKRAYKRCDSERRPWDFVYGEATAELASMIQAARESMGCKMKH